MNTYTEKIGNRLNALLEKTYDAEKGFRKAAEHTDHEHLKKFFEKKARQRKGFGHQLRAEIHSFGQSAEAGPSLTATIHRTWMDLKVIFASDSDEAMLEEAIRGERAAIKEYEEVLKETVLPPSTEMLLQNQKSSISAALSVVQRYEGSH